MRRRVGMLRSLYYYLVNPYWTTFFDTLGFRPTTAEGQRADLPSVINRFENELCLPVKYFLFQVENLLPKKPQFIFVPLVGSLAPGVLSCPKIIMTPDLVRLYFPELETDDGPKLLQPVIYLFEGGERFEHFFEAALSMADDLGVGPRDIGRACVAAEAAQRDDEARLVEGCRFIGEKRDKRRPAAEGGPRVLLLGHRYSIHNAQLNNGVVELLRQLGASPLAKEHMASLTSDLNLERDTGVDVDLWFSEGAEIFAAANRAFADPTIRGVVYLSMFNCGFDSVIEDVIEKRLVERAAKPYLHLVVDEHSSRVNLVSRLEVFMDIVGANRAIAVG